MTTSLPSVADRAGARHPIATGPSSAYDASVMEPLWGNPLPVNLSIKNAPDDLVARLRLRAERNHRSMQGELLAIIEDALQAPRPLTPAEMLAASGALRLNPDPASAAIVRADRDRD